MCLHYRQTLITTKNVTEAGMIEIQVTMEKLESQGRHPEIILVLVRNNYSEQIE